MKRFFYFILIATTLVSCTTTRYGMTRATLNDAVDEIKADYYAKGYYLTSEQLEQVTSTQIISNNRDARNSMYMADNANSKVDEYSFQDTMGNTLKFAIAYNEAYQNNTMYLLDVNTIGCETSNPKDYEPLCGRNSPLAKIKQIPQDKEVVVGDAAKTQKLVTVGAWSALGVAIIWALTVFL